MAKRGFKVRAASALSVWRPEDSDAGLNPHLLKLTGEGVKTCVFYNFTINQPVSDELILEHCLRHQRRNLLRVHFK